MIAPTQSTTHGMEHLWCEKDNAVGDEIIRAIDWHHNAEYSKVVHGLWQGQNIHYVILDLPSHGENRAICRKPVRSTGDGTPSRRTTS